MKLFLSFVRIIDKGKKLHCRRSLWQSRDFQKYKVYNERGAVKTDIAADFICQACIGTNGPSMAVSERYGCADRAVGRPAETTE